jgi:hypothetical protein
MSRRLRSAETTPPVSRGEMDCIPEGCQRTAARVDGHLKTMGAVWRLGAGSLEVVRKNLETSLAERMARDQVKREPCWTESLAVGSSGFIEKIRPLILSRLETEIVEMNSGFWELKETEIPYGQKKGPKNDPKMDFKGVAPRIFF